MNVPFFSQLKALVDEGGFKAYLVGGCVRDVLLERPVADVDLVCLSHDYRDFAAAVRILLPSAWVEFKDNIRLVCPDAELDISKPRGESIEQDLLMRDFTINNLAMDFDGNIIGDPADVHAGVIRHVSERTFEDDPLRMLRAFRFQAQLGFLIADETMIKINAERRMIELSASERILQELSKLLSGKYAAIALSSMNESGLFAEIFTNIRLTATIIEAAKLSAGAEFFLAALAADQPGAKGFIAGLGLSSKSLKTVLRTAELAGKLYENSITGDTFALRRLIYEYPDEVRDALQIYGLLCARDNIEVWNSETYVHRVMIELGHVDFEMPMRVNGGLLMEMGVPAGRLMGEIIADVRPKLASRELLTIDCAEKYIKDKYLN
jgi:poly(A) polymerase